MLNSTGKISLGGSVTGESVNLELSQAADAKIALNDTNVRNLTVSNTAPSSRISLNDLRGRSVGIAGSILFDGTNYLSITGGAGTAMGTGDFTWECFVFPTFSGDWQRFIESGATGSGANGYQLTTAPGSFAPVIQANGSTIITSTILLTQFAWNHVAVTRSGTTVTIWVNGSSGGTATNSLNLSNQSLRIGADYTAVARLRGSMSNIRIVKGVAVYTGTFTPTTIPLTKTQSSGANISAIIAGQTQLLLNTYYGANFLVDSSDNNFAVTNVNLAVNLVVSSEANPFDVNNYTLASGTKAPVLGASGQSPFPESGWTSIVSASGDDTFTEVTVPFTFTFNGTAYTSYFPSSNFYITFGSGSGTLSSSISSPAVNKIAIAGNDNSWQRVSSITSSTSHKRLRVEGRNFVSGTPGTPNMVYELTFFNPKLTGGLTWIELLVGQQARGTTGAFSSICSASARLTGGDLGPTNQGVSPNQSYVLIGNADGTSWTVKTGFSVGNTGY